MASVVGLGSTSYTKRSGRSVLSLAAEACLTAIHDAGMAPEDVDGIGTFQLNDSVTTEAVITALGLPTVNWTMDWLAGGNAPSALVGQAAAAIERGDAEVVVCFRAMNGRSGRRLGGTDQPLEAPGPMQYYAPMGLPSYPQRMAMWCQRHRIEHGTDEDQLGAVAMMAREHAGRNPRAMQRRPLTKDEYLDSRWIVEPFRMLDICLESDGACAVVVTRDDRARDCPHPGVRILSWAYYGGRGPGLDLGDLLSWGDLTRNYAAGLREQLFGRAGITPEDLDVAEIYDCFTFTVLLTMESLGIFEPGAAGDYFASGGGRLGSRLPVNTHGGLLSEAYIHGMNTIFEAVEQLRGTAGERQVDDAELAVITSGAMTVGSGMILGAER